MTQAPYQWERTGNCPSCGAPIYGRIQKPGHEVEEPLAEAGPEAKRTCPPSCPHGKVVSQKVAAA